MPPLIKRYFSLRLATPMRIILHDITMLIIRTDDSIFLLPNSAVYKDWSAVGPRTHINAPETHEHNRRYTLIFI